MDVRAWDTYLEDTSGYTHEEERGAVERLLLRQTLIDDFIGGEKIADTVLDCLEEHDIDIDDYIKSMKATLYQRLINLGFMYKGESTKELLGIDDVDDIVS